MAQSPVDSLPARHQGKIATVQHLGALDAERLRLHDALGRRTAGPDALLRSMTSVSPPFVRARPFSYAFIAPFGRIVGNFGFPSGMNDGLLWAAKGGGGAMLAGVMFDWRRLRLTVAPEVAYSTNIHWLAFDVGTLYGPVESPDRSYYAPPWYPLPYSIDMPWRFGDRKFRRIGAGQSSIAVRGARATYGVSSENMWWGPGVKNALVMSNNAGGFPHAFFRTTRPLKSAYGTVAAVALLGGLGESRFFDTVSTNNLRSLSGFALSFQPTFEPNLTLGLTRVVYGSVSGWRNLPARVIDALRGTARPNERALADSSQTSGREQIASLFWRWLFPADGFEFYGEWARSELPLSLRDFLLFPERSQAYTVGLQWARPLANQSTLRLRGEHTDLEQSASWRYRSVASFYTSRSVVQGYTHLGQVIGAAYGPGGSGQWLAADFVRDKWEAGVALGRIRWNNDWQVPVPTPSILLCSHDATVYPAFRAAYRGRWGDVLGELTMQNRLNQFFQTNGSCPNSPYQRDLRNLSYTIVFQHR